MIAMIGGAIAVVVVASIVAGLAFAVRGAEQRCADARVGEATKAGLLAIAAADVATWKNTAADEKKRADALDDVLNEVATSGDAAGARSRVLSRWAREVPDEHPHPDPAHGHDPGGVPAPPPAPTAKFGDDLIPPRQ